ncbi:MAG: MBL fold metallo-hydrolase [Woeseiaceae bacterium]|nr:MBL fold metallo-hydrolase [Woeseiaceae bacterium]
MSDELTPGVVAALEPWLRRLVAPNPGLMTGPGTNTYLVGVDEIAVIDPGPAIDAHVEAILAAAGASVRWLIASHTHTDHSPAVARLARATGATVVGLPAPAGPHQDATFAPDLEPGDGERLIVDGIELEILHTPGHASNHLCFFHRQSGWLFTGDHVINGSTVVIDPPDGSMGDYLESLAKLRRLPLRTIAGGHGHAIEKPAEAIDALMAHRLKREARVRDALALSGGGTLADLVVFAYDDVEASRHALAQRSLLAHLEKLEAEGTARRTGDRWSLR